MHMIYVDPKCRLGVNVEKIVSVVVTLELAKDIKATHFSGSGGYNYISPGFKI